MLHFDNYFVIITIFESVRWNSKPIGIIHDWILNEKIYLTLNRNIILKLSSSMGSKREGKIKINFKLKPATLAFQFEANLKQSSAK